MSTKLADLRNSLSVPGPTTDTSSRISRLRKIHSRVDATPIGKNTQLYGHQAVDSSVKGVSGDSSQHTYFKSVFGKYSIKR
tara:strand:+ start:156 stop:398 length:243 start_codon:yes stop_codon:yes gene_type:complete